MENIIDEKFLLTMDLKVTDWVVLESLKIKSTFKTVNLYHDGSYIKKLETFVSDKSYESHEKYDFGMAKLDKIYSAFDKAMVSDNNLLKSDILLLQNRFNLSWSTKIKSIFDYASSFEDTVMQNTVYLNNNNLNEKDKNLALAFWNFRIGSLDTRIWSDSSGESVDILDKFLSNLFVVNDSVFSYETNSGLNKFAMEQEFTKTYRVVFSELIECKKKEKIIGYAKNNEKLRDVLSAVGMYLDGIVMEANSL